MRTEYIRIIQHFNAAKNTMTWERNWQRKTEEI